MSRVPARVSGFLRRLLRGTAEGGEESAPIPTEATGVWYLADNMWIMSSEAFTTGTAIYWDRYVKEDGRWQIIDTKYERIYELNEHRPKEPPFAYHYLGKYASPPA